MQKSETWVSDYLKAKSPDELKMLMLMNNIKRKAYHEYTITHDGSQWFAWFEVEADEVLKKEYERLNERLTQG